MDYNRLMATETKEFNPDRYNLPSKIVTTTFGLKPKQDHQVFEATETARINDAHSAMYITKTQIGEDGRQKYALFDFGMDAKARNLIRWLQMHDGDLGDIEWWGLTHAHEDHVKGLRVFDEGTPVHVSEHDSHVLLGELPSEGWIPGMKDKIFKRHNAHIEGLDLIIIDDGYIENIGTLAIQALASHGHTSGHMSYLLGPGNNGKYDYVAGDSVDVRKSGKIKNAARPFSEDRRVSHQSIIDLGNFMIANGINLDNILTAHSGESDYPALIEYLMKHQGHIKV